MPSPYSDDFRRSLVHAYQQGEHSQPELAKLFGVGLTFIQGVLRRFRKTGSSDSLPHGGGMPPKLDDAGLAALRALSARYPDATLEELALRFEEEHNLHLPTSVL